MDRDQLENLISCGLNQTQIAGIFDVNPSTVSNWCKKYNLFTNGRPNRLYVRQELPDRKICFTCKKEKNNSEFYKRTANQLQTNCKECKKKLQNEKYRIFKKEMVDYKGGECQCCGYNNCFHALDFHHINPKTKSFAIANTTKRKITQEVAEELDKCILVCSNCHREIHAGYIDLDKQNISNLQKLCG
jgi:transposase